MSDHDLPPASTPGARPKDPLHGVTLEQMIVKLVELYGWEELGKRVRIKCFQVDPSVSSSLKFLRKTPWAREKVESFYLYALRKRQYKL